MMARREGGVAPTDRVPTTSDPVRAVAVSSSVDEVALVGRRVPGSRRRRDSVTRSPTAVAPAAVALAQLLDVATSVWGEQHNFVEGNQLLMGWAGHSFPAAMALKVSVVAGLVFTLWSLGRRLPIIQRHLGLILAAAAAASLLGPLQNVQAFIR